MRARALRLAPGGWRAQLIAGGRPLFPEARPVRKRGGGDFAHTSWPGVGDGWRALVETACLRRDAAVAAGLAMLGLKAEFSTPQLLVWLVDLSTGAEPAFTLAAGHAEVLSPPLGGLRGGQIRSEAGSGPRAADTPSPATRDVGGPVHREPRGRSPDPHPGRDERRMRIGRRYPPRREVFDETVLDMP